MIKKNNKNIDIKDLGIQPYKKIWDLQKNLQQRRIKDLIKDTLILVEHVPVYTLGRNANSNHLLQSRDKSINVYNIERGGDITFHGPGQLVGYPILDLSNYKKSITWYMRILEQVLIDTLGEFGIFADRKNNLTGVWVNDEKIAAQGVRISRWVTMHGFSLNVNPDLTFYEGIIPCGIFHCGITSMEQQLRNKQDIHQVKQHVINNFHKHFKQA